MAKKRLNKKVALIGSMVFVLLGMAAIFVFLRFGGDPQKFIEDGDAAWKAAKEAIDDEVRTEQYEKAAASYHKARTRAKTDSLRVKVLLKLADIYLETGEWKFVRGCWYNVIQLDPKNVKARFGQLKYVYIVADNYANAGVDALGAWKEVQSQASEFIVKFNRDRMFVEKIDMEQYFILGPGSITELRTDIMFSDFNEKISINLPKEALNAV